MKHTPRVRTPVITLLCSLALVFLCAPDTQAQSCVPPPNGQVHWYPFDGTTNDIAENQSGILRNGATFAPGMVGQALSLDGVDDFFEVNGFFLSQSFSALSMETWIKPTQVATGRIFDKAPPGGTNGFLLELSGGHLRAVFGANSATSTASIPAGTYTHVAATYDGTNIRLYINGALDSTTAATTPGAIASNSLNAFIGAGREAGTAFGGQIDEFAIYRSTLTAGEIQAIYAAGSAGKCKSGRAIISEFRFVGPTLSNDEFVEIYNNSDSELIVQATDGSGGWGVYNQGVGGGPRLLFVIPNGTPIPPRGHYLAVNNGGAYSLANYGGTNAAAPDITYAFNLAAFDAITLATSANGGVSPDTRLDRVGFAGSSQFYLEGAGLPAGPAALTPTSQFSYVRKLTSGVPQDTNDNAADFLLVSTEPATTGGVLGAPGPENTTSPVQRNATIKPSLVDPNCSGFGSTTSACARVRTAEGANPTNAAFGTLRLRRKFTNKTGANVTRLRFRVTDMTTTPEAGVADLRVIGGSGSFSANLVGGGTATIERLTLEQPPAQPNGGGFNSTVTAGTITLGSTLVQNDSINVEFILGVQQEGAFRFFVNVEALPAVSPAPPEPAVKASGMKATSSRKRK
jgi:Concanavalin A-like lectin/glucanases superfamily